jgi:chloride channel 3/4/5
MISYASEFTICRYLDTTNTNSSDKRWHMIFSLAFATIIRTLLVIISFGCKVPAGIFVPSMAVGAAFGRMVGILVQSLHESFPTSSFFSACAPDQPCITPGTYAFLGAAAALSGIMHITVSVVVIMFEITGALTYILPTMIVVGVTKAVSERFGHGGIADRMIYLNGYPFLDNKEEHSFGVPVTQAMSTNIACLPATGLDLRHVEKIMAENEYQGYPIVSSLESKTLLAYIGRTELRYALDKARTDNHATNSTPISFSPSSTDSNDAAINLSRFSDPTPLTVHPRLPLETVMEIFKKMGPRAILIEHRGRLVGLVTVKDCLKYQFKVEAAAGHGGVAVGEDERMEGLWMVLKQVMGWVHGSGKAVLRGVGVGRGSGEVRLRSPVLGRRGEGEELEERGRSGNR